MRNMPFVVLICDTEAGSEFIAKYQGNDLCMSNNPLRNENEIDITPTVNDPVLPTAYSQQRRDKGYLEGIDEYGWDSSCTSFSRANRPRTLLSNLSMGDSEMAALTSSGFKVWRMPGGSSMHGEWITTKSGHTARWIINLQQHLRKRPRLGFLSQEVGTLRGEGQ